MARFAKGIFIFRRDLRLEDNTGLALAASLCDRILPVFIFDPRQANPARNPYFGERAFGFLLNALASLSKEISGAGGKLEILRGEPHAVAGKLIRTTGAGAVFVNADYTPFSKERDAAIKKACLSAGAEFFQSEDAALYAPGSVLTADGRPYTVFTPFFRNCSQRPPSATAKAPELRFLRLSAMPDRTSIPAITERRDTGREAAAILAGLASFKHYARERDIPSLDATTGLSPHLKFGTVSPRQAWHACAAALGTGHPLLRQLCWRDFFINVANFFPHVFGSPFREKFAGMKWEARPALLQAWQEGRTGFPIVDAGMRELNATGRMHNRVRMITASFLVKDLHIDWREGERYFASRLLDYDPALNNGNWQWCAGTGCDAQPFFRIFNPMLQARRYDPDCIYIKRWVPELGGLSPAAIHSATRAPVKGYPPPMADHAREAARALFLYKAMR